MGWADVVNPNGARRKPAEDNCEARTGEICEGGELDLAAFHARAERDGLEDLGEAVAVAYQPEGAKDALEHEFSEGARVYACNGYVLIVGKFRVTEFGVEG